MKKIDLSSLWPHQKETYEFSLGKSSVYDLSSAGCVSHDTEFLTPNGWKRICDYEWGDHVAQINPSTLQLSFAEPIDYIKQQCSVMYHFDPTRGVQMMLSAEHRVLYYSQKKLSSWNVCTPEDLKANRSRFIAATFVPAKNIQGISLSDEELRVMTAVIADGHFPNSGNRCVIRIKKQRKKDRLVSLLNQANISFQRHEGVEGNTDFGFSVFSFVAPLHDKVFDGKYWKCNLHQIHVIADEVLYWDGNQSNKFFSSSKQSADFIQYVFSACGYPTSLSTQVRIREGRKNSTEFVVTKRETCSPFVGNFRPKSVKKVRPKVPFKYCFTTETSFWLARYNGYIFATGNSGKTIAHAKVAENFLKNEGGTKVVIICPKTLVRSAWQQEFMTFIPTLSLALAEAPEANRLEAFESGSSVIIMNTDGLTFLAGKTKTWLKKVLGSKPMLIIDESSSIKNPNSKRTKAAFKIAPYFHRVHLLSATPAPNSVTELWSQAKVLDGGKRLGSRYTAFRNLMQIPKHNGPFQSWEDKDDAPQISYGLLADISIRHDFDVVMKNVPAMTNHIVYYDLPKKHYKSYVDMEKNTYLEHENKSVSALNAASLATKLLQIASGAVYTDPTNGDKEWTIIDSGRYELIADMCEARPHTVVFFAWGHQKKELSALFDKKNISYSIIDGTVKDAKKRAKIVEDFEAGKQKVIMLHPLTGAHGLTLTKATTVIWASPTYNADWFSQGNSRIRRGRQHLPTESIVVLARNTRDLDAYEVFSGKKDRMDALNNLFATKYG